MHIHSIGLPLKFYAFPDAPPCRLTVEPLTRREGEVLLQLACGKTNKEIAQALDVSVFTVRDHVSRLLEKSGARTRCELIARYLSKQTPMLEAAKANAPSG